MGNLCPADEFQQHDLCRFMKLVSKCVCKIDTILRYPAARNSLHIASLLEFG